MNSANNVCENLLIDMYKLLCNWVICAWRAVKVTSITNGFKKAGITNVLGDSEGGESDASSDDEQMESSATLDPVRDAHFD